MFTLCTVCTCKRKQKTISLFICECTEFIVVGNEKVFIFILRFFVLLWEYAWVGKFFLSYVRICSFKWTNTYGTLIHFHTNKIKTSCNSLSLSIFCNVILFSFECETHFAHLQKSFVRLEWRLIGQREEFSILGLCGPKSVLKSSKHS